MNNTNYTYQKSGGRANSFSHQMTPFFFFFFSVLFFFTGCMKEDYSLCIDDEETRLLINFTYTDSNGVDKFNDEIHQVDVVLFNDDLQFYRILTLNKNELQTSRETTLIIEPGTYYVVGWGNIAGNTQMSTSTNGTSFTQSFLSHVGESTTDSIHYAPDIRTTKGYEADSENPYTRYRVDVEKNKLTKHTLPFMGAYHTINVYVTGLEDIENSQTEKPEVYILNLSSGYNYLLEYSEEETILFRKQSRLEYHEQNPLLFADFLVPHFKNESDIRVQVVRNTAGGTQIDELILSDFLKEKKITVTDGNKQIINIEFKYEEENLVYINLPDWVGQSVNPSFD